MLMSTRILLSLIYLPLFSIFSLVAQDANLALANDQLVELASEENYTTVDITNPVISDYYTSNGITHIYFQQTIDQISVFGANAAVHIKNNEVFSSNINFLRGIEKRNIKNQFQVQALEALVRLAQNQNYPLSQTEFIILSADEADPSKPTNISADGISNRTIPLRLVFLEDANQDLQLAWSVFIDEKDGANYKNFFINAATGAIEKEINLTISCNFDHDHSLHHHDAIPTTGNRLTQLLNTESAARTLNAGSSDKMKSFKNNEKTQVANSYNVYPIPIENPNYGGRSIEISPWDANRTASPNGWHQIGSTTYTTTRGNNADAYEDSNSTNTPTNGDPARVNGGATLEFDNPLDINGSPANYQPAAITNLFYWSNIIHDVWYNYGFDESSGNFQEENYGRGGNGSDYIYAEAQDGSGSCNANMSTPSDGGNPRMQMFLCNGQDGDFDNSVIVHEYGHGISIRLTGGPSTSSCLNNQEQMGEGWSDWFGTVMTMQAGDVATKVRPLGTWLLGEGPTGDGIRLYPYTTDMTINPMTYGMLPNNNISVPHGVGTVWATMLWDLTWAMIDRYGWDADLYNGTGGNNRTMALVIESLKLQPCSPGFVDGRDAILAADRLLYGGDNQCLIWEAFARRGLGYSADQGSTGDKSDGTEAFDMPPTCTISLTKIADKTSAKLGESITYQLSATNEQSSTVNDLVFTDFLPANLEFVSASDNGQAIGQTVTWPAISLNPGENAIRTVVAKIRGDIDEIDPTFTDDLENGTANWGVTNNGGDGTWNYQSARSNSASNAFHSPGTPFDSYTNLTSTTTFGVTETSELIFHHYYDIESRWDAGVVEISTNNGANWTDLGTKITQNGYTGTTFYGFDGFYGNSNAWVETKIDLSEYANQKVLIRFQMRYDFSIFEEGWFIDDISITNLGVAVLNQAQIGNRDLTSSVTVNSPTQIDFEPSNCLDNLNVNLDEEILSDDYRFANDLVAAGVVKNGEIVGFYAGNAITLRAGFIAENGSTFTAAIEACDENTESSLTRDAPIVAARSNNSLHSSNTITKNTLAVRPNPFYQQAVIDYQLTKTGSLWIGLHDITGKIVKVLHNQTNREAGTYQLVLNSDQLDNGAYWLTMRTQEGVLTKKLFLIRR